MAKAHCTLAETGGIIFMGRQYDIRRAVIPADGHDLKLVILQPKGGKRPPERTPGILWNTVLQAKRRILPRWRTAMRRCSI